MCHFPSHFPPNPANVQTQSRGPKMPQPHTPWLKAGYSSMRSTLPGLSPSWRRCLEENREERIQRAVSPHVSRPRGM